MTPRGSVPYDMSTVQIPLGYTFQFQPMSVEEDCVFPLTVLEQLPMLMSLQTFANIYCYEINNPSYPTHIFRS